MGNVLSRKSECGQLRRHFPGTLGGGGFCRRNGFIFGAVPGRPTSGNTTLITPLPQVAPPPPPPALQRAGLGVCRTPEGEAQVGGRHGDAVGGRRWAAGHSLRTGAAVLHGAIPRPIGAPPVLLPHAPSRPSVHSEDREAAAPPIRAFGET